MERETRTERTDYREAAPPADAIIIGAGPVGMAAGLATALGNVRQRMQDSDRQVTLRILEQRVPIGSHDEIDERSPWSSRLRNIVLDRPSVDFLASLGVRVPGQRIVELHVLHGGEHNYFPASGAWARAYETVYSRLPYQLVSTGELERALLDAVERLRRSERAEIDVTFGVRNIAMTDSDDGVSVQYSVQAGARRSETARLGIVADGANSNTLAALGIGRTELKVSQVIDYLAADFTDQHLNGGRATYRFVPGDDVSWLCTSFTAGGMTSLIMVAPPAVDGRPKEKLRTAETAVLRMATKMGITGRMIGKIFQFTNRIDFADKVQVGHIYVIGAAARRTNPASGNGVNIGLIDVKALKGLLGQICTPGMAEEANNRFVQAVARNTADSTEGSLWVDEMMAWLLQDRENFRCAQSLWRYGLAPGAVMGNYIKNMLAFAAERSPDMHRRIVEVGLLTANRGFGLPLPPRPGHRVRMNK